MKSLSEITNSDFFIFQNTITNADKLLAAADELAQTGECDPQEIYREARQLEERMHSFLTRVERRRALLDMATAFYTHTKEVRFQSWNQGISAILWYLHY